MAREAGPRTSCAMPLLDHQMALGQCLRGTDAEARTAPILDAKEQGQIDRIVESAGFRFTRRVQRSWCRGRVASVARLTLSALPPEQAQKLLGDWVEMGGGTASHTAAEAGAFLEFIARDLPDPSHARSVAWSRPYRASEAATDFECPDLRPPRRSRRRAVRRSGSGPGRFFRRAATAPHRDRRRKAPASFVRDVYCCVVRTRPRRTFSRRRRRRDRAVGGAWHPNNDTHPRQSLWPRRDQGIIPHRRRGIGSPTGREAQHQRRLGT